MSFGNESRKESITDFTTNELLHELYKRDGVSSFTVKRGTLYYDVASDEATILVVKKRDDGV